MSCDSQASCEVFMGTQQSMSRKGPHASTKPSARLAFSTASHSKRNRRTQLCSSKGRDKDTWLKAGSETFPVLPTKTTNMLYPSDHRNGSQHQVLSTRLAVHSPRRRNVSHSRCVQSHGGRYGSPSAGAAAPPCTGEAGGPGYTCPSSDSASL